MQFGLHIQKTKKHKNSERIEHQPTNIEKKKLSGTKLIAGRIYFKNKMLVFDVGQLKLRFIEKFHDDPAAKHPGKTKTYEILSRYYY